jgi:hypothetical protein
LIFMLLIPYRILSGWMLGANHYFGYLSALPRLPCALYLRLREPAPILSEQEIMLLLNKEYINTNG